MATQLWLLRHAEAEPRGPLPDEQRALTERGERQARAAGAALAALGVRLDVVLSSPRVRALETARLACEALAEPLALEILQALSAGFNATEALAVLAAREPGTHVMLVGHEPDFSEVIGELTGARVKLKKGGIAMVDVSEHARVGAGPSAASSGSELIVLARPRELALIAGVSISEV
jgi:phosphohistidine phosphatase